MIPYPQKVPPGNIMKTMTPNLKEYLVSVASLNLNAIDYGEHLSEMQKKFSFADELGHMTFVIDFASMMYPFLGRGTCEVLGQPIEAIKEGGVEFTMSNFLIPDHLNRQMIQQQIGFFSNHSQLPTPNIRFKIGFPTKDQHGNMRYIFQQHLITHRTEDGHPLGCYGTCSHIHSDMRETKIYQQIEVEQSGTWRVTSYKEFYPEIDDDKLLSKREIEILKYIADGWNSKQISEKLFLSPHTINTHRKNMLRKTNSSNTADLLAFAVRVKWI